MPFSLASADRRCDSGVAAAIGAPTIGANRNFAARRAPGATGVPVWVAPAAVVVVFEVAGVVAGAVPGVVAACAFVPGAVELLAGAPGVVVAVGAGVVAWLPCAGGRSALVTPIGDSELLHAVSVRPARTANTHVSELRDFIYSNPVMSHQCAHLQAKTDKSFILRSSQEIGGKAAPPDHWW
jgi:hypothetical protein